MSAPVEHTPGAWMNRGRLGEGIYISNASGIPIAVVYGPKETAAAEANAALICAAPVLLKALRELVIPLGKVARRDRAKLPAWLNAFTAVEMAKSGKLASEVMRDLILALEANGWDPAKAMVVREKVGA